MATVAVIVGAAIINAIAFTAGNALYDKFGREDGSGERLRHNLAVEDLQKASNELNQKRIETRIDFINNQLREKNDARNTFDDVDKALDFYNETHSDAHLQMPPKPVLGDFYKPSDERIYYELVVAVALGIITGYGAYKLKPVW